MDGAAPAAGARICCRPLAETGTDFLHAYLGKHHK
jgi:hypothetical protein